MEFIDYHDVEVIGLQPETSSSMDWIIANTGDQPRATAT